MAEKSQPSASHDKGEVATTRARLESIASSMALISQSNTVTYTWCEGASLRDTGTSTSSRELGLDRTGSPLVRRSADELFERPAKCSFGFVADLVGDGNNLDVGIGEPLGSDLHPPLG